ncbi:hypothetical protein QI30_08410 [Kurthia sp. 3B1D]|uniref:Lipoprotein n=1 Tax=Candidatus Kurthia intestinigallinarum TaxID=1562256 RepID=A0A433RUW4_9BACL|nr:hypothetical protein [Kurthia sp. 3B1D]RUS57075.1 hypothetical protein QI30_08410 [Kurthia sp. 3B1D]
MRKIKSLFILAALSLAACSNNSINIDTHSEIVELSEKELNSIAGEKDQNITPENFKKLILYSKISNYDNLKNAHVETDVHLKKILGDVYWAGSSSEAAANDSDYIYEEKVIINLKNTSEQEIKKALKNAYITVVWDEGQHTDRFDNNFQ